MFGDQQPMIPGELTFLVGGSNRERSVIKLGLQLVEHGGPFVKLLNKSSL